MKLELISKFPDQPRDGPAFLFVHGMWHGAWCWDAFFLDYFASQGIPAYAVSLRGHGASEGRDMLRSTSISDYAADLAQVVESLPSAPILVGHSMGGYVVQKYLETHQSPGAVLMASAPPTGIWRTVLRTALHAPLDILKVNLTLSLFPIVSTPQKAHSLFFSNHMPREQVKRYHELLQDESYRAFFGMIMLELINVRKIKSPIFVCGGNEDTVIHPAEVAATAHAYGGKPAMFDNMAHDMMLESNWRDVADAIIAWSNDLDFQNSGS